MHGCLSADCIGSKRQTVFGEWSSRKTVSFEEQIVSRDKYLCIFVCKMEAILSLIFQILLQCTGEKPLKLYASIMTCSFSLPTLFCVPFNRPSCRAYTERQAQQTYKLHSRYLIKATKLCTDLESVACIIHMIQIKLHVLFCFYASMFCIITPIFYSGARRAHIVAHSYTNQ